MHDERICGWLKGFLKSKKLNWNFQRGHERSNQQYPLWEGKNFFLVQHICKRLLPFYLLRASDQKIVVSGVVTKGNADFKAEAVKVAHEKPVPQHDKRPPGPGGKTPGMVIHQPRK